MIGDNLRNIMAEIKIPAKELAEKLGISPTHLSYVINNKRNPSLELMENIANVLGITMSELLKDSQSLDSQLQTDIESLKAKTPQSSLSPKEERDIARDLEKMLSNLENQEAMSFYDGEPLDDESKELLRISLENSMRLAKQMAKKKFTPNKYKK
jgi:transcriptional regulator with XRE-family HTH domain